MNEFFKDVNVNLDINKRNSGYGDFRDWFILEKRPVHETELQLFINDELVHESLFPINTEKIVCKIKAEVIQDVDVQFIRWDVPEMGISRKSSFNNAMFIFPSDKLNIDLTIEINAETGD